MLPLGKEPVTDPPWTLEGAVIRKLLQDAITLPVLLRLFFFLSSYNESAHLIHYSHSHGLDVVQEDIWSRVDPREEVWTRSPLVISCRPLVVCLHLSGSHLAWLSNSLAKLPFVWNLYVSRCQSLPRCSARLPGTVFIFQFCYPFGFLSAFKRL